MVVRITLPPSIPRIIEKIRGIVLMDSFGEMASEWDARDTYRALERMQETLLYVALGMNYADYMKYKQIAGHVMFAVSGEPHFSGMQENIAASDAEFVVSYCIDTVVQIQACVGSLDAPFGSDRWY